MSEYQLPKSAWDYTPSEIDAMFHGKRSLKLTRKVEPEVPAAILRDKLRWARDYAANKDS